MGKMENKPCFDLFNPPPEPRPETGRGYSKRISALIGLLDGHPSGLTTLEIDEKLREMGVFNMAISSTVADLRKIGYPAARAKFLRINENGKKIFLYRKEPVNE
jgi:hypothetical protein